MLTSCWALSRTNFNPVRIGAHFKLNILLCSCNKTNQMHQISRIYFWNKTLHVSDSSPVHHQEFFAVHTTMVYVIQVCCQLASRIRTANLYDIHHCCVYIEELLLKDRGTVRNMQSFIPKINLRNQCIQLVLL